MDCSNNALPSTGDSRMSELNEGVSGEPKKKMSLKEKDDKIAELQAKIEELRQELEEQRQKLEEQRQELGEQRQEIGALQEEVNSMRPADKFMKGLQSSLAIRVANNPDVYNRDTLLRNVRDAFLPTNMTSIIAANECDIRPAPQQLYQPN